MFILIDKKNQFDCNCLTVFNGKWYLLADNEHPLTYSQTPLGVCIGKNLYLRFMYHVSQSLRNELMVQVDTIVFDGDYLVWVKA